MGWKVFVSYKYGDTSVMPLRGIIGQTRVRDYVDVFQTRLDRTDHINKGENDGEDLSDFADDTIASRLRDKIYDSSITVVFISPNMKTYHAERDQWIPWEVSYSLRESTRADRTSRANGVLAVALPDSGGSYSYYIREHTCPLCDTRVLATDTLFGILSANMFNTKSPQFGVCTAPYHNRPYAGWPSYIHTIKWEDFISDISGSLAIADRLRGEIGNYAITKTIT